MMGTSKEKEDFFYETKQKDVRAADSRTDDLQPVCLRKQCGAAIFKYRDNT